MQSARQQATNNVPACSADLWSMDSTRTIPLSTRENFHAIQTRYARLHISQVIEIISPLIHLRHAHMCTYAQEAYADEIVIFSKSQALPRYIVHYSLKDARLLDASHAVIHVDCNHPQTDFEQYVSSRYALLSPTQSLSRLLASINRCTRLRLHYFSISHWTLICHSLFD